MAAPDAAIALPGRAATLAIQAIIAAPRFERVPPIAAVHVQSKDEAALAAYHPTSLGPASLRDLVARHAAENGVPVALANAIVMMESRYQAHIAHGGAMGLMQIKPQTARGVGFSGSSAELYDPETNVTFGMKYLAAAYRQAHGDVCHTVMRYQSGLLATRLSAANLAYCAKAKALMARV